MAVLQTGQSFSSGDQVTATKLEDIANLATFRTGANQTADGSTIEVDSSGGYLKVPSNGIGLNQLSSDASVDANRAVDTNHIKDNSVTYDKIQDVAASSVIGNTTGSTATPADVSILDEDDMASDSDTSLATQQSIKAYVDTELASITSKYDSGWASSFGGTTVANNADMTITHNLSTTAVTVAVYVNSSASDSNAQLVNTQSVTSGVGHTGYSITSLSSNSFTLSLSINGYLDLDVTTGNSSAVAFTSKFLKVVVIG